MNTVYLIAVLSTYLGAAMLGLSVWLILTLVRQGHYGAGLLLSCVGAGVWAATAARGLVMYAAWLR